MALRSLDIWHTLETTSRRIRVVHLRDLFREDPGRFERFSLSLDDLLVDYSKHLVTAETHAPAARARARARRRGAARSDVRRREDQHHREPRRAARRAAQPLGPADASSTAATSCRTSHAALDHMRALQRGACAAAPGPATPASAITDVVNIGIGGSDLGPAMVDRGAHAVRARGAAPALRLQRRRRASRRDAARVSIPRRRCSSSRRRPSRRRRR